MVEKEQAPASGRYLSMDPETEAREATWNLYIDDSPDCKEAVSLLEGKDIKFRTTRPGESSHFPQTVPYLVADPLKSLSYTGLAEIKPFVEEGKDEAIRNYIRWLIENAGYVDSASFLNAAVDEFDFLERKEARSDLDFIKLLQIKRDLPAIKARMRQLLGEIPGGGESK